MEHAAPDPAGGHRADSCGNSLPAPRADRRGQDGGGCDSDPVEDAQRGLAGDERSLHLPDQSAAQQPGVQAHPLRRTGRSPGRGLARRHLSVAQEPDAAERAGHPSHDARIYRGHAHLCTG